MGENKDLRMYILVNEDVKIGKGKLAGQVGHAVASIFYNQYLDLKKGKFHPIVEEYMDNHQKKILLKCPQSKLEQLESEGYVTIRDRGWTQLEPNTLTCVNLGILDSNVIPEKLSFIKDLKLV